jgi:hypothetical protein
LNPDDAWGLKVWNSPLSAATVEKSLQLYDDFYTHFADYFDELLRVHKQLIVYDLHTYNHRRDGYDSFASVEDNPDVNIGTRNINRAVWGDVVDTLIDTLSTYNFEGRHLSVAENVKFQGGYFGEWLSTRYQDVVCPISIEIKKFFMNEWTGKAYESQMYHLRELLISTIRPVLDRINVLVV